jgi:crossover junction endodeoxyribonuclease RuvC
MIIIGIDPGSRITGYGVIQSERGHHEALDFGCIHPPPSAKFSERCLIIANCLDSILDTFSPEVLIVETQYVDKNVQSAIKLGMIRGVVILAAKRRGIKVFQYAPTQAKLAVVGSGKASKSQVQQMVKYLLHLDEIPHPEDASDALALALCYAQTHYLELTAPLEI